MSHQQLLHCLHHLHFCQNLPYRHLPMPVLGVSIFGSLLSTLSLSFLSYGFQFSEEKTTQELASALVTVQVG